MELLHQRGFTSYVPVLGQVQDAALMESIFRVHRPHVVFHAAAYKHVPMLECNPWQAVANNILGSRTVMEASERHGVQRFVLVSTDKAVRPTNVMGASKRGGGAYDARVFRDQGPCSWPCGSATCSALRVQLIPLFREQIERGGPVTVTHRDVTRYFMTIPEAAQLIVQAGAQGRGGEVFVLKMGKPVRIADLARDLIVLSGKDPAEIEIRFTGLRPGEKLYEELITAGEDVLETGHSKIMVLRPGKSAAGLGTSLAGLMEAAARFDMAGVRRELKTLVPEYCPEQAGGCRTGRKERGLKTCPRLPLRASRNTDPYHLNIPYSGYAMQSPTSPQHRRLQGQDRSSGPRKPQPPSFQGFLVHGAFRVGGSRLWPIWWRRNCTVGGCVPTFSTATMSAMVCAAT